jgi:hypothetical protein
MQALSPPNCGGKVSGTGTTESRLSLVARWGRKKATVPHRNTIEHSNCSRSLTGHEDSLPDRNVPPLIRRSFPRANLN